MLRRGSLLIFTVTLAVLQVALKSRLGGLFAKPVLEGPDYAALSSKSRSLILLIGLALIFLILQLSRDSAKGNQHAARTEGGTRAWWAAFLLVVVPSLVLVLYVNPDGRLPWNQREVYIAIPSRTIKPLLYGKLPHTPDVIIFGSSVSFTMPADYFKQKWGVEAFNMSISGGEPSDFLDMLNFIIATSPDHGVPSVVTIELLWSDLRPATDVDFPIGLLPYMDLSRGTNAVLNMLDYPLQMNSVFNSIFTILFVDSGRWQNYVKFAPDGTAIRTLEVLPTDYRKNIKNEISAQKRLMSCRELDPAGMEYVEKIAALGEKHHFAVVFYAPPINEDFYRLAGVEPRRFSFCRGLVNKFMRELATRHSNVFFRDLVNYVPISSLGRQIYLDSRHFTREGNLLVLQALQSRIRQALKWARENR